jgi:hypothetical protein
MSRDLIIQIRFGGLGDHLFNSHIPRIAKATGAYDRVLISNQSEYRDPDYRSFLWETNPHIDGFTDLPGQIPIWPKTANPDDMNLLDGQMLSVGLDDGIRFHEPELYFQPAFDRKYRDLVVYDPNWISDGGEDMREDLLAYVRRHNIRFDAELAPLSPNALSLGLPILECRKGFEHFCSLVLSAKAIYCLVTGTSVLGPALKRPCHVFAGRLARFKRLFTFSMVNQYLWVDAPVPPPPSIVPSSPGIARASVVPARSHAAFDGQKLHRARMFYESAPSSELHENLERQTPGMANGRYKNVEFVTDGSYQFAIFINAASPVHTPSWRNACFLMEPPDKFRPRPHPSIGTLFTFNAADSETFGTRCRVRPMLSFLHTPPILDRAPPPSAKSKLMSMVVSGKTDLPYQAKRLELAIALIKAGLPIDFFGRDFPPDSRDPRIKGPFPGLGKTIALRDYAFSIACENSPFPGYLTEKLFDCIANNCIPITNNPSAGDYLPPGSFIALDFRASIPELVGRIADLVAHPPAPDDGALLAVKRELLNGTWSLAEAIVDFINGAVAPSASPIPATSPTVRHAPLSRPQVDVSAPPLLSVVLVTDHHQHRLKRTVDALRAHLADIEPDMPAKFLCFAHGSAAADHQSLGDIGFDLVTLSRRHLGLGPALNQVVAQVRTPWMLTLLDDWELDNPGNVRFIREAVNAMIANPRIGQVKLDASFYLDFCNPAVYQGPFQPAGGTVPFYRQNPTMLWGGFGFAPALSQTAALRDIGPFREDRPGQHGWAECDYSQRFCRSYTSAKSPLMTPFRYA